MLKKIKNIVIIALVALITIISMANLQMVTLKVLFFSFEIPLIILFYTVLIIGFSAGYITKGFADYRKSK